MKMSRRDLQDIFNLAREYFLELSLSQGGLSSQEFNAKCYLLACQKFLNVEANIEFPINKVPEPVED